MASNRKVAISQERVRAFWWTRQAMGGAARKARVSEVLAATGWLRSVGGCNPYLALRDRAGLTREAVDREVAAVSICELPSARGCTYVVPSADFALALRAGQGKGDSAEVATAKKHLGVTDKELAVLERRTLDLLAREPLEPAKIKEALGSAVRSLGEAGKKRGIGTTLPLVLGRLQSCGRIRRVPANGRLDQQRFKYVAWSKGPLDKNDIGVDEVAFELAKRFFRWAGPATVPQFAWWSGLGVKAARAAASQLGLVGLDGPEDSRLLLSEDREALLALEVASKPCLSFVSSLDNLTHLRRDAFSLLDAADAKRKLPGVSDKERAGGTLQDLPYHPIVDRGRIVGLWDYDGMGKEVVHVTFGGTLGKQARAGAEELGKWVEQHLGDVRTFSLDSPESRGERLDALRRAKL